MFKQTGIKVKRYGGVSILRKYHNLYLREFCTHLKPKDILNLGARPNAPDKEGNTYENYFPSSNFKTLDLSDCNDPRHIRGDLMNLDESVGTYDLVLAMSVIEHIDKPWPAAEEITRIVGPGGYLLYRHAILLSCA